MNTTPTSHPQSILARTLCLGTGLAWSSLSFAQAPVPTDPATPLVIPQAQPPAEPQAPVSPLAADAAPRVSTLRIPAGALQPDIAVDSTGRVHLVALVGDSTRADIEYRLRAPGTPGDPGDPGDSDFGPPIRVNSQPGSATGAGATGGPRLALGKDNVVHVVWVGSESAQPRATPDPRPRDRMYKDATPLLYARLVDSKPTEQRNLLASALTLGAGPAILAADDGRVLVFANADQNIPMRNMESSRRIFLAESKDNGVTFAPERIAAPPNLNSRTNGATESAPPVAVFDAKGAIHVLYRAAGGNAFRSVQRMTSRDAGKTWLLGELDQWRERSVPTSTLALARRNTTLLAAWQTRELNIEVGVLAAPDAPPKSVFTMPRDVGPAGVRRDPVLLVSPAGFTLVAWSTITAGADDATPAKAHAICWQLFDAEGRLVRGASGVASDLPIATRAAGWVNPDGTFSLIY